MFIYDFTKHIPSTYVEILMLHVLTYFINSFLIFYVNGFFFLFLQVNIFSIFTAENVHCYNFFCEKCKSIVLVSNFIENVSLGKYENIIENVKEQKGVVPFLV